MFTLSVYNQHLITYSLSQYQHKRGKTANGGAAAASDWHGPLRVGAADADGEVLRVAAAGADVGVDVAHGFSGECMWVMG